ncbi:hypothetical protein D9757_006366 [Collybiopsis confluens]|uniref:AB hydrolase-1 domain-containing protein n=1 Tax=Collybiopsis confluens TaxID=2823264 RepID=A0A8H5HGV7_9AGAR|nr:hypothetical protein D9757_006366 [Collybiopsis confluens]
MLTKDLCRLESMAPEVPPGIKPDLPTPIRKPLWHDDPAVLFSLSTHIIDAAPTRTCPEFEILHEVVIPTHARSQAADLDPKTRQKMAKENVAVMWGWRKDLEDERVAQGKITRYERSLWVCLNRYVRTNLAGKSKGITLLFTHAIGINKETWEPVLYRLLKSDAGRDIDEIWVWENFDTGDSALLNEGRLNQLGQLVLTLYASNTVLTLLEPQPIAAGSSSRVTVAEFEERTRQGFSDRRLLAVGHSFGGNLCARACLTYPRLFKAMILADPGIVYRDEPTLRPVLTFFAQGAFSRKNTWGSREEALPLLQKSPFFGSWHAQPLQMYVEHGLFSPPGSDGVILKMHPVWEALCYTNGLQRSGDMFDDVPKLDEKVYIKWVMPDVKKGGGLSGVKPSALLVKLRPGFTANVNIQGAGHMIPLEKPDEMAREIEDTIKVVFGSSAKL